LEGRRVKVAGGSPQGAGAMSGGIHGGRLLSGEKFLDFTLADKNRSARGEFIIL